MTLTDSMLAKLAGLRDRYEEVSALLSDPEVMGDRNKFAALSKEYAELEPVVKCYDTVAALEQNIQESQELLEEDDAEMKSQRVVGGCGEWT